ncbi:MON1 homolog B, secretory trafficking associated, partial [Homo sapiens]
MEVGGDTAAPAPGGAEDLEDTQFPSEEAREGGGVHAVPPDPEDEGLEETGSKDKDQPPSPSPPPQSEALSSTSRLWSPAAPENSPTCSPESSSGGQGGDPSDEEWRSQRK